MSGDKSIIVSGFSAGLTQPLLPISEISWRETKMKGGPSELGGLMQPRGKKLGGRKRVEKGSLILGGKKKKEDEKEGRGGGQLPSKRPPTRFEPPLLFHGAPYRETNTTGITGEKIREGVERGRD